MYKFLFELLINPLGLPIPAIYEYIVLALIDVFAFKIAWNESPGGFWGSEIHWLVRVFAFAVIWAIAYIIIIICQWLINNWVLFVTVLCGFLIVYIIKKFCEQKKKRSKKYDEKCSR